MAMNLSQFHENRAVWKTREEFRYSRWLYWHNNKTRLNELEKLNLRKKWWKLYIEAREKRVWYDHEIARSAPKSVGEGTTEYDGHPVANWIIPQLQWAKQQGWSGYVVSGYRTASDQWAAAVEYCRQLGVPLYQEYPNGPLASNHCGYVYPKGAVDVTDAQGLYNVLRRYKYNRKLIWAEYTIEDGVHFSSNGH